MNEAGRPRAARDEVARDEHGRTGATRWGGRVLARLAALVAVALVAPLVLVGLASPATAAMHREFTPVFSTNTNGVILMAGNTLMSCRSTQTACAGVRGGTATTGLNNNDHTMAFVDADTDGGTFNSSSADLTIPQGGSVLFAGLVWGGRTTATAQTNANPALRNQASFRVPGAPGYTAVTGRTDFSPSDNAYQSYLDVTNQVAAAGSGTYWVGNVQSTNGSTDNYAGWSLVVVVSDPAAPARNLTVFQGYGSVRTGDPLTIPVTGFTTPPSGPIRTDVGVVTYEGDLGYTGDQMSLNGISLSDGANPANNVMNSTITRGGVDDRRRNPAYRNQLGFDSDIFTVGNTYIRNGDSSATIALTTTQDVFYPGLVTFSTELYDPTLLGNKSVELRKSPQNTTPDAVERGDTLRYTVPVSNIGLDIASDSRFFDAIPTGTTYVPGSLRVDGEALTDAQGDDRGYYQATPNGHVVVHLGTGATAATGGDIPITPGGAQPPHTVTFDVRVDGTVPNGAQIVNAASMTYRGLTTRASAASASNVLIDAVVAPPVPAAPAAPNATPHVLTFTPRPAARTLDIDVLAGDTGTGIRVVAVTDAAGAALTINPDGTVRYAPRADFAGRDVFTYTIEDSSGQRSTAAVQVVVVNELPVAVDDTATTPGASPVTIAVLGNDTDPNGDALAIRSFPATTAHGTIAAGANGTLVYTPNRGFRGTERFDYVLEDSRGGSDTGTVTVTVTNAAPVGTPDTYRVNQGGTATLAVLANDSDPDGDTIRAQLVSEPAQGTVTLEADGTGTYTAPAGFRGTTTFTYRVLDDQTPAGQSAPVTVTITVNGVPVAAADTVTLPAGASDVVVTPRASDPDGDALTLTVAAGPAHGTAAVLPDGTIRYTPAAGWAGTDSLTYRVTDADGLSAAATLTLVTPNTPPVAVDDEATVGRNATVSGIAVLANDSDVNVAAGVPGQALALRSAVADNGATVTQAAGGLLTVTPAPGFVGVVTVRYVVEDGAGGSDEGVLRVTVVNSAPTLVPGDPGTTATSTPVLLDLLVNASDADPGETLTLVPGALTPPVDATGTVRGTVTVVDGRVRYVPPTGWAGTVTFGYGVSDGADTATGTTSVVVANAAPVAQDRTVATPSGTAVEVDGLAGATDANIPGTDQVLTVTGATSTAGGSVTVTDGRTLTITPDAGHKGRLTVTYTVSDGAGGTGAGTVTVTVANAAPVTPRLTPSVAYGTPVTANLLAGATDANPADTLTLASVGTPVDAATGLPTGTLTRDGSTVTFTPARGFSGTVRVPYAVSDGTDTTPGELVVTIANAAPTAVDDAVTTPSGTAVTYDVVDNDTDPNVPSVQTLVVTGARVLAGDATVEVAGDRTLTVTPAAGYKGEVTVEYDLSDGAGGTDAALLVVTVANAAPVADDDAATTPTSTPALVPVLDGDTDANGDTLTVVPGSLSAPRDASGTVRGSAAVADGGVLYTPPTGWTGTVTFTYAVTDGEDADTATVTVVVENAAPVVPAQELATDEGTPLQVDGLAGVTDANVPGSDQVLVVSGADADNGATVTQDGSTLTVTPAPGFVGTVTLTWTVSDGAGGSTTGTATVSVANAAPVVPAQEVATPTGVPVEVDALRDVTDANIPATDQELTVSAPAADNGATATLGADGRTLTVTPAPGFAGTVTVTYTVSDGAGGVTTGTVTVTVENAAPTAVDDVATTATGTPVTVEVVANDTDPNVPGTDQALVVTAAAAGDGATVATSADGRSLTVTPAAGFKGDVRVTYTVSDGAGGTDEGVLVVTVANAAPVLPAVRDTDATPYGVPVVLDLLDGVTDANGDPLEVVRLGTPVDAAGTPRGTLTLVDGVVTYTPPTGWSGTVTFDYDVTDGTDTVTGRASVTVGNGAPVARPDTARGTAGQPVTIDVLANDTDPEGGPLTIVDVTQPESGRVEVVDGTLVLTPAPGFTGTVTFTYTVADATGARTTSTVTVEVVAAAAGPAADGAGGGVGAALARTGLPAAGLAGAAVLLLVLGAGLVVVRRRRATHTG